MQIQKHLKTAQTCWKLSICRFEATYQKVAVSLLKSMALLLQLVIRRLLTMC